MTRFLLSIIILITLVACRPDSKNTQHTATATPDITTPPLPIPFAGDWISEDYLIQLHKHKSPRKAQDGSEECFITIPTHTRQTTTMIYNFHESGPELETVKTTDQFQLWEKHQDSLTQLVYTIREIAPDTIQLGHKRYVRIRLARDTHSSRILEEILFKGTYKTPDGKHVEFKNNGQVTGLSTFHHYVPLIDYFDAGLQVDQVALIATGDQREYFGFKFKKNVLELYALKCKTYDESEKRCIDVDYGPLQYKLTRVAE